MKKMQVLLVGVALTALVGSTVPVAHATGEVAYENGVSVSTAIQELKNTVAKVKLQLQTGGVQKSTLETLASKLYQLEKSANGELSGQIVALLNTVEDVVNGVSGNENVLVALQTVRDSLGIGSLAETTQAPKANAEGISFTDVSQGQWYYDSVMAMASQELLKGVGNGEFAPQADMTRASYITIAVRIAYPNELIALNAENPNSANWWDNAWSVAHEKGLIKNADPNMGIGAEDMNGTIRREEMALILQRIAHAKGVATSNLVFETQIPDFKEVAPYYRDSVRECYTLGMLNGTDQLGTFSPKGTLDRASASQSFYKLLNADKRTPVTPQAPSFTNQGSNSSALKPASTLQTFKEGEAHTIPQEGDTVIAKDGRTVVLTMNQVGDSDLYLLGWGQGVDIITGTTINGVPSRIGGSSWYDSTGLTQSPINNEVYSHNQWSKIENALNPQKKGIVGDYDGEIYQDYFKWDASVFGIGGWDFIVKGY